MAVSAVCLVLVVLGLLVVAVYMECVWKAMNVGTVCMVLVVLPVYLYMYVSKSA